MNRALKIGAVLATLTTATAATAAEHEVLVLPDAYFPSIVYLDAGDTVTFTNLSGVNHNIVSGDASWTLGPISDQTSMSIVIEEGVATEFYDADQVNPDGSFLVMGQVSFDEAPLN